MYIMGNRILIVDDNQQFLLMLQEFLADYNGVNVVGAAVSGQEALSLIEITAPDMMIVDLWMPDMSGLDLTQAVKGRWPNMPTIVLTLSESAAHRQAAFEAGADAFVGKSRMDAELMPAIQRLMTIQQA